jgi:hypothetical protein
MSLHSFNTAVRLPRGSLAIPLAIALGFALAACGGGGEGPTETASDSSVNAAHDATKALAVTVEGCVLDRYYIPTTGTPVRALSTDGRLLGSAVSDGQGRFTLRLPARSEVMLQIDRPHGESMPMRVDAKPSKWETCLLDETA